MQQITKVIDAYTWDELSDKAKDRVRDNYFADPGFDWWKYLLDQWADELGKQGFSDVDIHFSGFCSQGDGACFTAEVDLAAFVESLPDAAKARFAPILECWAVTEYSDDYDDDDDGTDYSRYSRTARIVRDGYYSNWYSHKHTIKLEAWYGDYSTPGYFAPGLYRDLLEYVFDFVQTTSDKIYRELEQEYFYMVSDEYIRESCEANGYLFTKYGKMV